MEGLKTKRQMLKGSITRIHKFCLSPSATVDDINARVLKLEDLFVEYTNVQDSIDTLIASSEQQEVEENYRKEIEDKYFATKSIYLSLIREEGNNRTVVESESSHEISQAIQAIASSQNSMSVVLQQLARDRHSTPNIEIQTQKQDLKVPLVQLPEFDGSYMNWIRFRDLFDALIHKSSLSNVEKLEFLQTKVTCEALSLIKHLKPTNDNYTIAWQLLNDKYNNSEQVKRAYFEQLFDQPAVKSPTLIEIKRLYYNTNEAINAIKVAGEPVEHWDSILLFLLERKLDSETLTLWCREKRVCDTINFKAFLNFLEGRTYELEISQRGIKQSVTKSQVIPGRSKYQPNAYATATQNCCLCNENHFLFLCNEFKKLSVYNRSQLVRQQNLCFNCLRPNHIAVSCKSSSCKVCGAKHNTLLHFVPVDQENNVSQPNIQEQPDVQQLSFSTNSVSRFTNTHTILPTAIVHVKNKFNELEPCRVLLDTGAQATLISEACVQRLNLKKFYDKTLMFGVGSDRGNYTKGKVNLEIVSIRCGTTFKTKAHCLSQLTKNIPQFNINSNQLEFFKQINLSDKNFCQSAPIDIIIGADIVMDCMLPTPRIQHPSGFPTAFETLFGWVVMGKIEYASPPRIYAAHVTINLDDQLRKFWEIESVSDTNNTLSSEEIAAEAHYVNNTTRLSDGKYMVRLPFKTSETELGNSKDIALKRFQSIERRFHRQPNLKTEYVKFINEYLELNHMEQHNSIDTGDGYFLPHHAIIKPSSSTTKLRVVFDGSCQTSNGKSLNDQLLVGPTIQNDLFSIILKFRKYRIGMCADIEKMYRQVFIHPDDRKFQKLLWRERINEPVRTYHLNTVTYGTSAAPFLAIRTLHQIAIDNSQQYPKASEAIRQHFFVDDFMSCYNNLESAITLKDQLCTILSASGFNLRKWSSNSHEFLETIDPLHRETSLLEREIDENQTVKTLGLLWNTVTDSFRYSIQLQPLPSNITKRLVLSDIAKIFDPIGWMSPVIITLKIFMQKLWLQGIGWDDYLSEPLCIEWRQLRNRVQSITDVKIPRWCQFDEKAHYELHGFADSSELAYAATVYLKVVNEDGTTFTNLLACKTKVAPVKQISIPRLELCAAHLLVKLMVKVKQSLKINCETYAWSDSTIVLAWISDHPRRWKTFIANRTSYIIDNIPAQQWRHISTHNNPADLATRGLSPTELIDNTLWWNGPNELLANITFSHSFPKVADTVDLEEKLKITVNTVSTENVNIFMLFSDYTKLLRTIAMVLRFINICKSKKQVKFSNTLTIKELDATNKNLVRAAQSEMYNTEIKLLRNHKTLPSSNKLSSLTPFLDNDGIMRVGGRIVNANIKYDQMHPMILNKNHPFTEMIARHYHLKYLHAGIRQMTYLIGLKYWIISVNSVVKRCVYTCSKCMRFRGIPFQQKMANLPEKRVQPSLPFTSVGVDYAGPIQIRSWKGRGSRLYKGWIAVFICLGTKAIHLEFVTELSSGAFMAALRRFVSRRGRPSHIYSDNGTNFVGSNQQLRDLYALLKHEQFQHDIISGMAEQEIQWHFSPPSAPHFGGIWEAAVKSTKYHLRRVLGEASATFEEMYTILCQIEACLNSRPLCLKFEGDIDPLTPSHFLILRPMASVPDIELQNVKSNYCSRWQFIQKLVQGFWKKWSMEYLTQLQHRYKWRSNLQNIKVGDIVIVKDDNLPPTRWSIAKVTNLHPGADGLVRVVSLKGQNNTFKRPVQKLCPLFLEF